MLHLVLALVSLTDLTPGTWEARLDAPLGPLPFALEILKREDGLAAVVKNGSEYIDVPLTRQEDGTFVFDFPHYNARLTAKLEESGRRLDGEWQKRTGADSTRRLPFHAHVAGDEARAAAPARLAPDLSGRWRVQFAKDPDAAVAILASSPVDLPGTHVFEAQLTGTFLTATGDYRWLAGTYRDRLVLSCFDGAHAFLFTAELQTDGSLKGAFSSGDAYTDTWTAVRDDEATIGDEFKRARWDDAFGLAALEFPDRDGKLVSLADQRYDGRARVLQIAGSWCPNCHDETALLAELDRKYRAQGLVITSLCFEVTGRREDDTASVRRLLARHGAEYEALLVGRSNKASARESLPVLDHVFAFPTTVFLRKDGSVRAVHSGFSGPATGAAHETLRAEFTRTIEEILTEDAPGVGKHEPRITSEMWRHERDRTFMSFERGEKGELDFTVMEMTRFDRPTRTDPVLTGTAVIRGTTVRLGAHSLQYDPRAHVILDPRDCGVRYTPAARSPFPVVDGVGASEMDRIVAGLENADPVHRRESTYYLALQLVTDRMTPAEYGGGQLDGALADKIAPLVADPDPRVRATASWAVGVLGSKSALALLEANLAHGFAPVRREAARALAAIDAQVARQELAVLARDDIDPLVRAAAARW